MRKIPILLMILAGFTAFLPLVPEAFPQKMSDVTSDHLLMRLPKERALLGRGIISDLERFYQYINRAVDVKLPRRIILLADWELQASHTNYRDVSIVIGMNQPGASNSRAFLLNEAMREIARMGLYELSQGADRSDYEFLYEGMVEILVNEFNHTTRKLESAWVVSKLLDEMGQLGLERQRSWADFSTKYSCFRNAAPGVTFLLTFRELKGRDRPAKFFQALKRANLSRSLQEAFDYDASKLETIWLDKVREYRIPVEITISAEDALQIAETELVPEIVLAGARLKVRLLFKQNESVLLPEGVFIRDERNGQLFQAQAGSGYISATIPVEAGTVSGNYHYRVIVIDESGNFRQWEGTYVVGSKQ